MYHPESAGDSASTRKMAHPAIFPRRGSFTGSGSASALTSVANTSVSNNVIPTDSYQSPLVIQPPPPAGSSSPGPQHHPQSLNLQSQLQSQTLQVGGQVKKKSGFQITSVTPAQISVSTNNSIAEDTESYDDLDESHTEDLSSSEILDVSLSRATDMGGPERSSSEETLSNLHEAETPGAVSPNQPPLPHPHPQAAQQGPMVNGTAHHHHPHAGHHPLPGPHQQQAHAPHPGVAPPSLSSSGVPVGGAVPVAVTSASGALPSVTQKLPISVVSSVGSSSVSKAGVVTQPLAPGVGTGTPSVAAVAGVNVATAMSAAGDASVPRLAAVPGLGGISAGGASLPPTAVNPNGGGPNVNPMQQQQSMGLPASVAMTTAAVLGSAGGCPAGVAAVMPQPSVAAPVHAQPQPQAQQAQAPPPASAATTTTTATAATASSRFRVVKLDSNLEPFRKGRWTCSEYYDKEAPSAAPASDPQPGHRVVESLRQPAAEGAACPERESASGGSVSSTLSHYSEGVGSGEPGGPASQQAFQLQDYASPPGVQPALAGPSQAQTTQPLLQQQQQPDLGHPLLKAAVAPSPVPAVVPKQAGQPVHAQGYPAAQPQAPTTHAVPVAQATGQPPDFLQHQPLVQAAVAPGSAHPLPHISGSVSAAALPGNSHAMAAGQAAVGGVPAVAAQSLPQGHLQQQQAPGPQMPQAPQGGVMPQMLAQPLPRTQPLPSQLPADQQLPPRTQCPTGQLASAVTLTQVPPSLPLDPQPGLAPQPAPGVALAPGQVPAPAAGARYAGPPALSAAQLEDARRLLFQHQSLLSLPKLAAGECASEAAAPIGPEDGGGATALPASAGLLPLKSLPVDGEEDSSSGASVVAIDNKIEQAMDLVKSHLMYAVREEVEVLKEQIKELIERNSQLEQENNLLKTLASPEQLAQFQAQVQSGSLPASAQPAGTAAQQPVQPAQPAAQSSGPSA
ncbi:TSC22 domain family protein 1-like isoform X1 [Megalops cyprinoides]|uniref:TSC22 domain family protein 1-like isoform X1 n=1 Tax=Megalops cyprinoides TaxID=118141 RepID=UPI001864FA08|nr:TSC22 domain family protein 1-like isoform X1 [Megalops cyprinoides]